MSTGSRSDEGERKRQTRGLVVTDSVHERLREPRVFCASCKESMPASDIARHFAPSHAARERCVYCGGKVFEYASLNTDDLGNATTKDETYHSCR